MEKIIFLWNDSTHTPASYAYGVLRTYVLPVGYIIKFFSYVNITFDIDWINL